MKAIFADTFYWVALTNADDMSHRDAVAFDKSLATSGAKEINQPITKRRQRALFHLSRIDVARSLEATRMQCGMDRAA